MTATSAVAIDRRMHFALALGLLLTIAWGFWPSYFGPLLRGAPVPRFWLIHVHVAVFAVWMLLIVTQASLVASGRVAAHRRFGVAVGSYGIGVLLVGLLVSVAAPIARVHAGQMKPAQAALVALFNLTDMLLFGGFLIAALVKRNRPDLHRRLMLSASVALAGAPVGRVIPSESPLYLLVWLWPLLALMLVELWVRRRVHYLSVLSLALFVLASFKVQLYTSAPMWRKLGDALVSPFL